MGSNGKIIKQRLILESDMNQNENNCRSERTLYDSG